MHFAAVSDGFPLDFAMNRQRPAGLGQTSFAAA